MTGLPLLKADALSVVYDGARVLDGVSLSSDAGSLIGLIGPNGAGKTTLIKILAGLLKPNSGRVFLDGKLLDHWSRDARARCLGYLSQDRTVHWPVSVERLVSLGRLPHRGPWDSLSNKDEGVVDEALKSTDVSALRHRTVTTLSGGELARVLLARVLAGSPRVLLADEPVSGLDPGHRLHVLERLRALAQHGCLVIMVMHDLTLASRFCDRLVLLDHGQVVADGPAQTVLAPEHLSSVYGVEALAVSQGGEQAVLPWSQIQTS